MGPLWSHGFKRTGSAYDPCTSVPSPLQVPAHGFRRGPIKASTNLGQYARPQGWRRMSTSSLALKENPWTCDGCRYVRGSDQAPHPEVRSRLGSFPQRNVWLPLQGSDGTLPLISYLFKLTSYSPHGPCTGSRSPAGLLCLSTFIFCVGFSA